MWGALGPGLRGLRVRMALVVVVFWWGNKMTHYHITKPVDIILGRNKKKSA